MSEVNETNQNMIPDESIMPKENGITGTNISTIPLKVSEINEKENKQENLSNENNPNRIEIIQKYESNSLNKDIISSSLTRTMRKEVDQYYSEQQSLRNSMKKDDTSLLLIKTNQRFKKVQFEYFTNLMIFFLESLIFFIFSMIIFTFKQNGTPGIVVITMILSTILFILTLILIVILIIKVLDDVYKAVLFRLLNLMVFLLAIVSFVFGVVSIPFNIKIILDEFALPAQVFLFIFQIFVFIGMPFGIRYLHRVSKDSCQIFFGKKKEYSRAILIEARKSFDEIDKTRKTLDVQKNNNLNPNDYSNNVPLTTNKDIYMQPKMSNNFASEDKNNGSQKPKKYFDEVLYNPHFQKFHASISSREKN